MTAVPLSLAACAQLAAAAVATYVVWALLASPLRHVPGPFAARLTDAWRLLSVLGRRPEVAQRRLHDAHGPVVRLGPSMVSVSDPAMIPQIYSRKTVLNKGDFYKVFDMNMDGRRVANIFSSRDEKWSSQVITPVQKVYSMGSMIKLEPLVDRTIVSFLDHLSTRFAEPGKACDINNWLLYCSWDILGSITFSEPFGFLKEGRDLWGILGINFAVLDYLSVVGQMPWLDYCFERNPIKRIGPPSVGALVSFVMERLLARRSGTDGHNNNNNNDNDSEKAPRDMLDEFMEAQRADSSGQVGEEALVSYILANVGAGSDTVAAELRSAVYHLCRNPGAMARLRAELDAAGCQAPVSWAACQGDQLPYLRAVVAESMRVSPGVALPLERRVGPGGLVLTSTGEGSRQQQQQQQQQQTFLPEGTAVGMNPYVVNRDRGAFGDDAHLFRPERWLRRGRGEEEEEESEAAFQERLARMRAADLTFGSGKRACAGRNLALIECHKIVASLFCAFDVELAEPGRPWTTHTAFMVRQSDMDVRLRRRRRTTTKRG